MKQKIFRKYISLLLSLTTVISLTSFTAAAQTYDRYDPAVEQVVSGYYCINKEKGYITGIAPGTAAQKLLQVCLPAGGIASSEVLATGTEITFPGASDEQAVTLTAIVTGDLNGDGDVTITDMLMIKSRILGTELSETAMAAADINYDGQVTITDFLKVKSCLLGLESIKAAPAPEEENLILLTPQANSLWGAEGISYISDNETVATVADDGMITAVSEGTVFVYALDAEENVLARQLVTVLTEPQKVTFDKTEYLLIKGQSQSVPWHCNHPVLSQITWHSSDPLVAEVSGGVITAGKGGTATITATVNGGSTTQLSVKVVEAVSDWVDIGQHRYYFDENGEMYHGWLQLGEDTYYLKENGVMAIGQVTIDGVNRFFTATGKHVLMPNPWNPVPEDYTCELVSYGSQKVSAKCADALKQMVEAGKKAGYNCNATSIYRSISVQQFLWDRRVQEYMKVGYNRTTAEKLTGQSVAIPGHSEHQTGLAADISKGNDRALKWLGEHCWEYGFILRYPQNKMDITGIMYEPWHFRYVGVELAMELKKLGLCMEEYMQMLTKQELEKAPPVDF